MRPWPSERLASGGANGQIDYSAAVDRRHINGNRAQADMVRVLTWAAITERGLAQTGPAGGSTWPVPRAIPQGASDLC
jgi:hypothetical protein